MEPILEPIHSIQSNLETPSNQTPHYKLIILVIASHSQHYDEFTEQWSRYMNQFPDVRSFFLYSDPTIDSDVLVEDNKITYKYTEWFEPGILYKTIAGMHVCSHLFTFDHMLRTNLSSFIHIPRLLTFLEAASKSNYVAAKQDEFREGVWFLSGAGFIVSRDVVTDLLNEVFVKNSINEEIKYAPDDVAITKLIKLSRTNVIFERLQRYDCTELTDFTEIDPSVFHIRNKTEWKYGNRDIDIQNMKNQVDNLLQSYSP
uniref:Uncharacterized protein n=1 Tax=viral metagenome TaxID=1070528 RepID=A0A6C0ASW4_9ZZZZ